MIWYTKFCKIDLNQFQQNCICASRTEKLQYELTWTKLLLYELNKFGFYNWTGFWKCNVPKKCSSILPWQAELIPLAVLVNAFCFSRGGKQIGPEFLNWKIIKINPPYLKTLNERRCLSLCLVQVSWGEDSKIPLSVDFVFPPFWRNLEGRRWTQYN